ncbi:hypothetical protein ACFY2R_21650 [Micromonospora olivasterospora]|uniref:Glutamine cyclotransferase n=1 Tax=Micromonospora olivasterospora TaxID=1880 RepID=A0A562I2C6_MICOL|nr:hypothetical protein [Micromonospora olivasterospora]TWH65102.1 hypothetical protein JD77_00037 [Micromonospora olivasterospora]
MPFAAGTVRDIPVRAFKLCGLTWFGEFLWFSEAVSNQIMALDPHTGLVEHRIPCPEVRTDLTTLDGYLLQVCGEQRCLRGLNPATGEEVTELPNPRPGHLLRGLEATRHGLWLGYEDLRLVELRDPRGMGLIDTFPVRHGVAGLTVSDSYLVYADYAAATINVYDLRERREVAAYSVAGRPTGVTWDGSRIWYCDHGTLQLRAIDVPGLVGS